MRPRPNIDLSPINAAVLAIRRKLGVSQTEFGKCLGVTRGAIAGYELNKFKPSGEPLQRLYLFFGRRNELTDSAEVEVLIGSRRVLRKAWEIVWSALIADGENGHAARADIEGERFELMLSLEKLIHKLHKARTAAARDLALGEALEVWFKIITLDEIGGLSFSETVSLNMREAERTEAARASLTHWMEEQGLLRGGRGGR